ARCADTAVGLGWKDFAVTLPQIPKAATALVGRGAAPPQLPPRPSPMIPPDQSPALARASTQRGPQPSLVGLLPNNTPHCIDLQLIPGPRGPQGLFARGARRGFVFTTRPPVCRATPKRRSLPRRLGRSE